MKIKCKRGHDTAVPGARYPGGTCKACRRERREERPLYVTWTHMKQRCSNSRNPDYANYGRRGIKVFEGWINNFTAFRDYINEALGPCPEGKSIDRKDNDGHYEPGNLRWATAKEQADNRRAPPSRPLPLGVYPNGKRFQAQIKVNGKLHYLGTFNTPEEAGDVVQAAKRELVEARAEGREPRLWEPAKRTLPTGVYLRGKRFEARIWINGKMRHLGTFDTPELAHDAFLRAKDERDT